MLGRLRYDSKLRPGTLASLPRFSDAVSLAMIPPSIEPWAWPVTVSSRYREVVRAR